MRCASQTGHVHRESVPVVQYVLMLAATRNTTRVFSVSVVNMHLAGFKLLAFNLTYSCKINMLIKI